MQALDNMNSPAALMISNRRGLFVMKSRIKPVIRSVFPRSFVNTLRLLLHLPRTLEKRRTQRIFETASHRPVHLDIRVLETLQMKYPPAPAYGYDANALEIRGIERAAQILRLPGAQESHSFLELGCWDGMVSCCLERNGKKTTAIDNRDAGFDKRASLEGVSLLQMDASDLQFEDERFDFVFSFDAFEHFASPEDALREAIRVVRKGGYIYLNFGPLYYSPYGEHAYRSITVPYCQFLFPRNLLNAYAAQNGLDPIDFNHVNGWSLERYRDLWSTYAHMLKRIQYHEQPSLSHLGLIRTYPSCFNSKSSYFDNFIVTGIKALFQKTGPALSTG
jgi:SAM-dependent methyltransferase